MFTFIFVFFSDPLAPGVWRLQVQIAPPDSPFCFAEIHTQSAIQLQTGYVLSSTNDFPNVVPTAGSRKLIIIQSKKRIWLQKWLF